MTQIRERLATLPGVRDATYSRVPLLSRVRQNKSFTLPGSAPGKTRENVNTNGVAPNFFATMALPILRGRGFAEPDRDGAPKVAIVNETFARQQFGGADPIGRRVAFGAPAFADVVEVVGVARDAKYTDLRGAVPPTIYLPAYQRIEGEAAFAVRAAGDPAALMPAVAAAMRDIDPTLPILDLRTQRRADRAAARERAAVRVAVHVLRLHGGGAGRGRPARAAGAGGAAADRRVRIAAGRRARRRPTSAG